MRVKIIIFILLYPVGAPVSAEEGLTNAMLEFGNPRTALFALLAEQPRGGAPLAAVLAQRLGVERTESPLVQLTYRRLSFEPILRYDNNTNGGMLADTVSFYGIPFDVNEGSRAVADATLGAAVSGGIGASIAPGTVLSFDSKFGYRRGIEHGLNIREQYSALSLAHQFQDWRYLRTTLSYATKDVQLGYDRSRQVGMIYGKVFGNSSSLQDVSVGVSRFSDGHDEQNRIRFAWETGIASGVVYRMGMELGQVVEDAHVPRLSVTAGVQRFIFERPASLNVSYIEESGSSFLGQSRADKVMVAQASYKLNDRFTMHGSVSKRSSSVDELSNTTFNAWFSIPSFNVFGP